MAVNPTAVRALKETFSREVLMEKRAEAAAEMMAGVTITQVTFEGGGASGQRNFQSPEALLELIQAAIDLWDDPGMLTRANASVMDFCGRRFGT